MKIKSILAALLFSGVLIMQVKACDIGDLLIEMDIPLEVETNFELLEEYL